MLGRKIKERQQRVAVFQQTIDGLVRRLRAPHSGPAASGISLEPIPMPLCGIPVAALTIPVGIDACGPYSKIVCS